MGCLLVWGPWLLWHLVAQAAHHLRHLIESLQTQAIKSQQMLAIQ
jgi:hypothetical protein